MCIARASHLINFDGETVLAEIKGELSNITSALNSIKMENFGLNPGKQPIKAPLEIS